jgi:hypothetical protein
MKGVAILECQIKIESIRRIRPISQISAKVVKSRAQRSQFSVLDNAPRIPTNYR